VLYGKSQAINGKTGWSKARNTSIHILIHLDDIEAVLQELS
jgi:hypothetical protein